MHYQNPDWVFLQVIRYRVGLIGANGQGFSDLTSFLKNPEIECVALCDIDRNVLNRRTDDLVKLGFPKPKLIC